MNVWDVRMEHMVFTGRDDFAAERIGKNRGF